MNPTPLPEIAAAIERLKLAVCLLLVIVPLVMIGVHVVKAYFESNC